ncbi:MAG: four helix bundle protein [Okeania sp. SIO2C9]|uniref:four helix bundle protein n=1 Tax=Okeania sp. SIO2C9 TaxID=2607791 RepID=UPI0013C0934D|nr:four helix bundle protein [Okeania sp. SIO2C9]NEQ76484.1 four helix bundle protein [Okeania sp. SIO2C9]
MSNVNISIQERTENFATRVVKAYSELNKRHFDDAGKVLSKQFLRSGTSIGANCSEAKYAQSTKDLINKYSIALKEANETLYWIKIMIKSEIVSKSRFQNMIEENERIIKILTASINKLKEKEST